VFASVGLTHVSVLAAVAAIQVLIVRRAAREAKGISTQAWAEIRRRCEADLGYRATRGMPPDWLFCQNEIDRAFESQDDRIRRLASAALAAGLGGTLLAIVLHFFTSGGGGYDPGRLISSTGVSLLGSLLGVVGHLLIVLVHLPRAEECFQAEARAHFAELQRANENLAEGKGLAGTLQNELSSIREAVSQQFSSVFATAVTGFPGVVEGLRDEVRKLAVVTRQQGEGLAPAAAMLASCAKSVEKAARGMQPGAEGLSRTAAILAELPAKLGQALDERRDSWLATIRDEQKERLDELMAAYRIALDSVAERERLMLERARELLAAVSEVHQAAGSLPEVFSRQIENVASRLGAEFGKEARQLTLDLSAEVQRAFEGLGKKVADHEQEWRNNVGSVIGEVLRRIEAEVRSGVSRELGDAARSLQQVAEQLPEAGRKLKSGVESWNASQAKAADDWRQVGESVLAAARLMAEAEGPLRASLGALTAGGEKLARGLREAEGLSEQVANTLGAATASHLDQVRKVQQSAETLLDRARSSQEKAEQVLGRQGDLIRLLLSQRRGAASPAKASA
jgi:hypothetical protein